MLTGEQGGRISGGKLWCQDWNDRGGKRLKRRVLGHMKFGEETGSKQCAKYRAGGNPVLGSCWNSESSTGCFDVTFKWCLFLFLLKIDSHVLVSKHKYWLQTVWSVFFMMFSVTTKYSYLIHKGKHSWVPQILNQALTAGKVSQHLLLITHLSKR